MLLKNARILVIDDDTDVLTAVKLLLKTEAGVRPVRLLGVSVHNFGDDAATPSPRVDLLPFDLPE